MDNSDRDPEAILARLQTDKPPSLTEGVPKPGRLKIFFGYAAGVGKTYTMLEAARLASAAGQNVLLGYIEAHDRPETEALVLGQDVLPLREIDYRGIRLREFDLDTALARKPSIVLVDELAHSNAAGCRHAKRWQDVEELLDSGIDVWTTVNVQHIESLNDVVAQITGTIVRETVPDRLFDDADEVELVDLPPEELRERFREGKVYIPEQAERAAERFFRKANLIALRELAMRRLADRINEEVQTARLGHTRTQTWPTTERLLVCVGPSPTSGKVIRTAKRMASALHAQWIAVHTETASSYPLDDQSRHRLRHHFRLAERLGAETITITGEDVAEEIVRYAQSRNVTKIVIGKTGKTPWYRIWRRSIVDRLIDLSGDIDVYVIRGVEETLTAPPAGGKKTSWAGYVAMLGLLAAVTILAIGFDALGLAEPNIIMTYLLAVVLSAAWLGRGPGIAASILAVMLFNFFFTVPYYTFVVDDSQYVVTFAVMLAVALIISTLTVRIRRQVTLSRERERRTEAHYRVSQTLASTSGFHQLAIAAQKHLASIFGGEVVLYAAENGSLKPLARRGEGSSELPSEQETALWVFRHGQPAGRGTDTLPGSLALYLPLLGADTTIGVLAWRPQNELDLFDITQRQQMDSFSTQIALALERDFLTREAQRILAEADAERLRNSMLSAVSHDLRTPLAAIAGSASTILQRGIDEATKQDLAITIFDQANRLSKLLENLLHLTRIESGGMKVEKQWQPIEEVVSSAVRLLEHELKQRQLEVSIPAETGLVQLDGQLIEQVLCNLLDNAIKYTKSDAKIRILARRTPGGVEITVADAGTGLDQGEYERIFDRFYRGMQPAGERNRGAGMGLSICKAIVQAHGGKIWAEPNTGGGTRFVFTLPFDEAPPQSLRESGAHD